MPCIACDVNAPPGNPEGDACLTGVMVELVQSTDGTPIAVTITGTGSPVVIVNGALSRATDAEEVALTLAGAGFAVVTYDRRARGDSGDTWPYAPEREVDDLAAVIRGVGGDAVVLGHSSGAIVTLAAAAAGVGIRHAILSEPPFAFDAPIAPELPERIQALVDAGKPDEAVVLFQLEGVGLPPELVEQLRKTPMFASLVPLAQSTVYDATIARTWATPTPAMMRTTTPVTILRGEQTFPFLIAAADELARHMPDAAYAVRSDFADHRLSGSVATEIVTAALGEAAG